MAGVAGTLASAVGAGDSTAVVGTDSMATGGDYLVANFDCSVQDKRCVAYMAGVVNETIGQVPRTARMTVRMSGIVNGVAMRSVSGCSRVLVCV